MKRRYGQLTVAALITAAVVLGVWWARWGIPSLPVNSGGAVMAPDDHRGMTARAALAVAETRAKMWNEKALLHEIAPTYIMQRNLGLPTGVPGWFFMFKEPGSPVELYVKIVDQQVNGWTEAQPILAEQLPFRMIPIDLRTLPVDNDRVLRIFAEQSGAQYVASHPNLQIDYRLVHLQGLPNPVWSLFDAATPDGSALLHVDAVTGVIVGDPFVP